MKKKSVLRDVRLVIYLTKSEAVELDKLLENANAPRAEVIRASLLSALRNQSLLISK
jgi:hypothetical protein